MKYYALILNKIGEWSLFAEAATHDDAANELNDLIKAGFPRERTRVVRAMHKEYSVQLWNIAFQLADGEVVDYPLHSKDAKRDFLIAAEFLIRRQFKTAVAIELQDLNHKTYCRVELGRTALPLNVQEMVKTRLPSYPKTRQKKRQSLEYFFDAEVQQNKYD